MQIGDQPASRDINTMSAKNKSSSSGNQFSLNGLQALVKQNRINEAYNQLTTHLLTQNSK